LYLDLSGKLKTIESLTSKPSEHILLHAYLGPKEKGASELRKMNEQDGDSDFHDVSSDEEDKKLVEQIENNDVRFMMPEHMPSYLRIDKDIQQNLIALSKLVKEYS
jgi:hypothetical protein